MKRPGELALRAAPWLALATAVVAATRFAGDAVWPCTIGCDGGAHYQSLWGVPVHVPAVLAMALVAVLAWRRPTLAALAAWAAAGGSLYFLLVAWRLELVCPYCFTVHAGVLLTVAALAPAPGRWTDRLGLLLVVGLGLHAAFHPVVVEDGPAVPTPVVQLAPAATAMVEALRRQGRSEAPLVLELALDLHCSRCAAAHAPLAAALADPIAAGQVEVVTRFLVRAAVPSGGDLAAHVLAARDPSQARLLASLLLGTPEGRGWSDVRSRVAELADPAVIEARRAAAGGDIAAVLAADAERWRALRVRSTPYAVLSRRDGAQLRRWDGGAFDPQAIARALAEAAPH